MKKEFPPELITGIEQIDCQHMELMTRIMQLYESYMDGTNAKKVAETMQYLKCYVDEHFAVEEKYMQDLNYPETLRHINSHQGFVDDYCELEKRFKEYGYTPDFNLDFNVKIVEWMKNHVMKEDKLLADFIKNNITSGQV